MHILITGGAGYIGSHVIQSLLKQGYSEITIADSLVTGFMKTVETLQSIHANITFKEINLADFEAVDLFLSENNFHAVIHFAASLVVPESVEDPHAYYLNNTANTTNLLKSCVKHKINKFIFSSTAAVYGEPDASLVPVTEETITVPINPYGFSKLFSEQIIKDTAVAFPDFKYVILRYFNVAGSDQGGLIGHSTANATHLIKVAAQAALGRRDKMFIFGDDFDTADGTGIRDYIHIEDLASAHVKALEYLEENESNIFNCGYGHGFSVKEVISTMKKVSGVDFKVEIIPRRAGDPAFLISDNSKIKNVMKWRPEYDDIELICQTALDWEKRL
jgi:UDP-glucose 4-epimerase